MTYNHNEIDKKWQDQWEKNSVFVTQLDPSRPKYYVLDMFPYPSGMGLHIGHLASYTPSDVVARYRRSKGFNVLHPMGYDAFGLPAEQFAIQTGVHPAVTTEKAQQNFCRQLKAYGFSFDWSREISTCDPKFYRWTQWIFLKLFEKGLAYQKEVPVNWCPALKTVLANEEVVDGKSERGDHPVVRIPMKQWMLKITSYAERLIKDLELVDWPQRAKEGQIHWIGKSEGAEIYFPVQNTAQKKIVVFSTRPDTLFGATFMVLAPEHPLVVQLATHDNLQELLKYQEQVKRKSELERKSDVAKTGVFTGSFALNPFTGKKIPIWVADYVLPDYGTGAIMAVPGHDLRDFEFATEFKLQIIRVVASESALPYEGDGVLCDSEFLNGLTKSEAISAAIDRLEQKGHGQRKIHYKLRDWLFSRQRYWGEPFPLIHYPDGEIKAVPIDELPVLLPEVADFEPTEKGEAPLARASDWVTYKKGSGQSQAQVVGLRETDTMPGSAGSSWYFLRFTDPHNDQEPFSFKAQEYWMPVDLYIGGPEHTVGHLLYSRFWHKVLFDAGLTSYPEPFMKLAHQGMILGADGEKMSKSKGDSISCDEVREHYGADAVRMYIIFLGPLDRDKPWSSHGIEGVRRFLERVWRLCLDENQKCLATDTEIPEELNRLLHKTIKKVTDDIESLALNTAVSAMMILVNEIYKTHVRSRNLLRTLCQLLMPFAPHLSEELWACLGEKTFVSLASWPAYDLSLTVDLQVTIGVQVNGKTRAAIELEADCREDEALRRALAVATVIQAVGERKIQKVIYRPGKIINLIVNA